MGYPSAEAIDLLSTLEQALDNASCGLNRAATELGAESVAVLLAVGPRVEVTYFWSSGGDPAPSQGLQNVAHNDLESVKTKLGLVEAGIGMLPDEPVHGGQVMRVKNIVVPDHGHEFIFGNIFYPGPVLFDRQGPFGPVAYDPGVIQGGYPLRCSVGTAIVQDNTVKILKGLRQDAVDAFPDIHSPVPHR